MSAPSFSSFPPIFSSFPDLGTSSDKPSSNGEKYNSDDKEKKRKKRERESRDHDRMRSKDKEGKHGKSSRRGNRRSEGHSREREQDMRVKVNEGRQSEPSIRQDYIPNVCYPDAKGDPHNIRYGSLHAGDVPRYKLAYGGRYVIGLPAQYVVLHRESKGVEIGPITKFKGSDLSSSKSKALLAQAPTRRLTASTSTQYDEVDGVIRLPSRRRHKGVADDNYRSLLVKPDEAESDSDAISESDASSSDEDEGERILSSREASLKVLEQELAEHPEASEKWLSLLELTLSTTPITSKNATKARCEITVSILTRAFSAGGRNASDKLLRLLFLKAGEEIWHESKLVAEWEQALKVGGIELQMEWLEWKIRRGVGGVERTSEAAKRVLMSLDESTAGEISKVRVFYRVASAIRDAGFAERAMAMFQALTELSFKCPVQLHSSSFGSKLDILELFWESEHPRMGEANAKGWDHWFIHSREQPPPPSKSLHPVSLPDLDPFRQWEKEERRHHQQSGLPTRSDCDTADPYSTILFAEVRLMMIDIKSQEAKDCLRHVWLAFLGLHIPGYSLASSPQTDWDDRWNLEAWTSRSHLNGIFPPERSAKLLLPDSVAGALVGKEQEYSSPFSPIKSWSYGIVDSLHVIPGPTGMKGLWSAEDIEGVDRVLVQHVFEQLHSPRRDHEWDALALAFESALSVKSAIKLSKSFLSSNGESLLHWAAHAQLQRFRGKLDEARKIYQTVLIAAKPGTNRTEASILWWNWAEMEWLDGEEQAAINVMLTSAGIQGAGSGVAILRGKRALGDAIDANSTSGLKEREAWIKLRVLFELIVSQQMDAALAIGDRRLDEISEEPARESLTTALLLMIYCHRTVLKKAMPPAILQQRALEALEHYPSNSLILGAFLEGEKGQGVWGRVRSIIGGPKTKDVARRIEEVWVARWQTGRWVNEIERTRSGLAAAVDHERTSSSPVLWRIYLEFEIRVNELKRAKKLLYRAIGQCPLVKELYLLAFGPLRGVFQKHELNALGDVMVERGLRLYQGLDEVAKGGPDDSGSSSMSELDEIEDNARELRRLRPY